MHELLSRRHRFRHTDGWNRGNNPWRRPKPNGGKRGHRLRTTTKEQISRDRPGFGTHPAHGSCAPSPLVSVNRRFFKLGSVCRMSSARRLRFAISYQNKRKRTATSPNQRKSSPSRCFYLIRTPRTRTDRCQHPWKTVETCTEVSLMDVKERHYHTRTYIRGPTMNEIPSLIRLRLPTHVIGYTNTSPKYPAMSCTT